jgi:hypothetical protein
VTGPKPTAFSGMKKTTIATDPETYLGTLTAGVFGS